jgi:hypothetical protein
MYNVLPSLLLTATMTLRGQALWSHSRPIKIVLLLLFLATGLAPFIVVGHIYAKATLEPATSPFTGCSIIASNGLLYIIYVPAFINSTVLIILTIIRSYPFLRQGSTRLPLHHLLLGDGLAFYCVIVAAQIITLICTYSINLSLVSVPLSGSALPVAVVACNRMLIRLQSVLVSQDVMALDPRSSGANVSAGLWSRGVLTTYEFSVRAHHFERGRGRKRRDEIATNWTELVLADLADHQHQVQNQATGRDPRRLETGAGQDVTHQRACT